MLRGQIRDRGLTQADAGALMGLTQSDVSDIVRGRLSRFSLVRLERCLNAFDLHVRIQVGRRGKEMARAGLDVELVESF